MAQNPSPAPDHDPIRAARDSLVACGRLLLDGGLAVGSAGNISVRVGDVVLITPSGIGYHAMSADDICTVPLAGLPSPSAGYPAATPSLAAPPAETPATGAPPAETPATAAPSPEASTTVTPPTVTPPTVTPPTVTPPTVTPPTVIPSTVKPSTETPMHLAIYAASPAEAIVHTHSPEVVALSAVCTELPAIHYAIADLGGPVRVASYNRFGSAALARLAVTALTGRQAVILQNHGAVCYGRTVAEAYERALLLEWLAWVYRLARSYGQPRLLSPAELAEVSAEKRRIAYGER